MSIPILEARKRFPPLWVVYHEGGDFVVKIWWGPTLDETAGWMVDSVEKARTIIVTQGGEVRFERAEGDDRTIVESWV